MNIDNTYARDATLRAAGKSSLRSADAPVSDISAFNVRRSDWQHSAERRLSEIMRLQQGWDGHQGRPVEPATAFYAFRLLEGLLVRPGVPLPSITPLSYGGLVLEWHRRGWDIEIEIKAPLRLHVYSHELASGAEDELELGINVDALRDAVRKISD